MTDCALAWGGLELAGCQVTFTAYGLSVHADQVSFEVPWACVSEPRASAERGMPLLFWADAAELRKLSVLDKDVAERVEQPAAEMRVVSNAAEPAVAAALEGVRRLLRHGEEEEEEEEEEDKDEDRADQGPAEEPRSQASAKRPAEDLDRAVEGSEMQADDCAEEDCDRTKEPDEGGDEGVDEGCEDMEEETPREAAEPVDPDNESAADPAEGGHEGFDEGYEDMEEETPRKADEPMDPDDESTADRAARAATPAAHAEVAAPVTHAEPAESEAPAAHAEALAAALAAPDAEPAARAFPCNFCLDKLRAMPLKLLSPPTREKRRLEKMEIAKGALASKKGEARRTYEKGIVEMLQNYIKLHGPVSLASMVRHANQQGMKVSRAAVHKLMTTPRTNTTSSACGGVNNGRPVGGAYALWRKDFKKGDEYTEVRKGKDGRQLIQKLAAIWRELPEQEKKPYQEQYKQQSQEVASAKGKRPHGDPMEPPEHGEAQPPTGCPRVLSTSGAGAPAKKIPPPAAGEKASRKRKRAPANQSATKAKNTPTSAAASSGAKGASSKKAAASPKGGWRRSASASSEPQPPPAGPAAAAGGARLPSRQAQCLVDVDRAAVRRRGASEGR